MADSKGKETGLPGPDVLHRLPVTFDFPGNPPMRVQLDVFQRRHLAEVRAIWQDQGAAGEGGVGTTDDFCHVEEEALRGNPLYRGNAISFFMKYGQTIDITKEGRILPGC